jgi:hypothetical protein
MGGALMTAAMVRTAARIVNRLQMTQDEIVSFSEIGSDGAILGVGGFRTRATWNISRDGSLRPVNTRAEEIEKGVDLYAKG